MFEPLFAGPAMVEATSDRAWLLAMLEVEAALARAGQAAGLVPPGAADAIVACCRPDLFDPAELASGAIASASPVVALVERLIEAVPPEARPYVHMGATSQDVMDTAMMLVARRAMGLILADLDAMAQELVRLATAHRDTPQVGRTLLRQAAPITFGLAVAGWLTGLDEARADLARIRRDRLAVQLGGAVGTLAAFGERAGEVSAVFAAELGLAEPVLPWHTSRGRVAELAGALGAAAAAMGGIALDVTLLAQDEIAELAEATGGGSSAMPHKRNPARAVLVTACAHRAPGLVAALLGAGPQELQRAAGRWQAEWPALTELLRVTGGAAAHGRALLPGLRIDAARMRSNLDGTGGVLLAARVTRALALKLGRGRAAAVVGQACERAGREGRGLREVLLAGSEVAAAIPVAQLDAALDPALDLAAAARLVDRALAAHAKVSQEHD